MLKLEQRYMQVFTVDHLKYSPIDCSQEVEGAYSTNKPLYIYLNSKVKNSDGTFRLNADGTFELHDLSLRTESQSQSYMLDMVHKIETTEAGITYIPVKERSTDMSYAECIEHNRAYKEFILQSVLWFKFDRHDTSNPEKLDYLLKALKSNGVCLQRFLPDGKIESQLVKRFIRTSSHSQAGGAWYSSRVEEYTKIFTYNQEKGVIPIISAPAKWDSRKALIATSSLPIPLGDHAEIGLCVVDDVTRLISTKVVSIAKGENHSPLTHLNGYSVDYTLNKEVEEYEYQVSEPFDKIVASSLTDGAGICTPELMAKIEDVVETKGAIQLRSLWMKGMLGEFDILGWCKAHNITKIRDIYGKFHYVEDISMIIPKSVFKCWNLYMEQGIKDIYSILKGTFELNGHTYKYFENGSFLRCASRNKAKRQFNPMTYQYLQSLINLDPECLGSKADILFNLVEEAMEDISKAKALLGMNQSDEDFNYDTITSKVCHLLEMCPETFNTRFIKSQIIKIVETMLKKQAKGRIMDEGSYHFLLPDFTVFFAKEVYREDENGNDIPLGVDQNSKEYRYTEVSIEECQNYTIGANDRCGILDKGYSYMPKESRQGVGFRSPLVHMAEPQKLNFDVPNRDELDRWFGQLKGCCIFNSYELTALAMGGADFDGDKIFVSFDPMFLNGIMTKEDGSPLDIVVSPLEGLDAEKVEITPQAMFEIDKRSLDNKTGLYTDMATYYMNYYYHVNYTAKEFLAQIKDPSVLLSDIYTTFNEYFPNENISVDIFSRNVAYNKVCELRDVKLRELSKAITITRIASAGEIDFPKHGMRFPMAKSVFTTKRSAWHKVPNYKFEKADLCRQPECGWGAKEYTIKEYNKVHEVVVFRSPMEELSKYVYKKMAEMKSKLTTNGALKLIEALITDNKNSIEVSAYSPQVKTIYDKYVVGIRKIAEKQRESGLDAEHYAREYSELYSHFNNRTASFSNRKALAEACLTVCASTKSDNFAFVCGFDGILEMLSERTTITTRVAEIEVPNYVSSITVAVEGKTGSYIGTCGEINTVDLPLALPSGEYKVVDTLNRRFVTFCKYVSKEDVTNQLNSARKALKKEHHIKLVTDKQYKIGITGLSYTGIEGLNAPKANDLIVQNSNTIMFREYTFLNTHGIEAVGVGVWVGDIRIGKLDSLDENQVTDDSMVKFKSLYNTPFKIDVVQDSLYKKSSVLDSNGKPMKTNGKIVKVVDRNKPSNGLNAVVTVASMCPITYKLDKFHNACDLTKWYWNVEWKRFGDLGFEFLNVKIGKVVKNQLLGRITLRQNQVTYTADVVYVGGKEGIQLSTFTDGYTLFSVEDIYRNKRELLAQIFRCISYAHKKATYKEPTAEELAEAQALEVQKQEEYIAELHRIEAEKQAEIKAKRDMRIKEIVARANAEWKAKCEAKGKKAQAKRNAEFQAKWEARQLAKLEAKYVKAKLEAEKLAKRHAELQAKLEAKTKKLNAQKSL